MKNLQFLLQMKELLFLPMNTKQKQTIQLNSKMMESRMKHLPNYSIWKKHFLQYLTDEEIEIFFNDIHESKELLPIEFIDDGNVIVVKLSVKIGKIEP